MTNAVSKKDERRRDKRIARQKTRDDKKRTRQREKQQKAAARAKREADIRFYANLRREVRKARKAYLKGRDLPISAEAHIPSPALSEKDALRMATRLLPSLVGEFSEPKIVYRRFPRDWSTWTFVQVNIQHFL